MFVIILYEVNGDDGFLVSCGRWEYQRGLPALFMPQPRRGRNRASLGAMKVRFDVRGI